MGAKSQARLLLSLLLSILILSACGNSNMLSESWQIALLAPFEGRYREVGYEAYYAAQLALSGSEQQDLSLLAVDDGGSLQLAKIRAEAIQSNPKVVAVLVLGYVATSDDVLDVFARLPVIVVGDWGVQNVPEQGFLLVDKSNLEQLNTHSRIEVTELSDQEGELIGSEILSLKEFTLLRDDLSSVQVLSAAQLPDESYVQRIQSNFPFADSPGLFSTLTYDAVGLLIQATEHNPERSAISLSIRQSDYSGINGRIRFEDGYLSDATSYQYAYDQDDQLYLVP